MREMPDLRITLGPLTLKNPVMTASGTFGYGVECSALTDVSVLGAVVTKSLSKKPRAGNPPQRVVETAGGMLNSIGLANIGVEAFIAEKLPQLRATNATVIANIAASSYEEYEDVLVRLEDQEGISGYEINVSCPNVKDGGLSFGTSLAAVAEITKRLRTRTKKMLMLKLTPNVTSIGEFAKACEGEGADAVSMINTLVGLAVDVKTRRPSLATVTGGLSGPAIKPVALAKVYEARKAVKIPIVGIGGIMTAMDALEFLIVGATAVEVGTALFVNPNAACEIVHGIETYCTENNIGAVRDLIGTLRIAPPPTMALQGW
jgi:dihydroorotate dehydrogenase (NAD+) catalytic subunit